MIDITPCFHGVIFFRKDCIMKKKYGILNFLLDLVLTGLTGGLWLIWIVFRFLRRNS